MFCQKCLLKWVGCLANRQEYAYSCCILLNMQRYLLDIFFIAPFYMLHLTNFHMKLYIILHYRHFGVILTDVAHVAEWFVALFISKLKLDEFTYGSAMLIAAEVVWLGVRPSTKRTWKVENRRQVRVRTCVRVCAFACACVCLCVRASKYMYMLVYASANISKLMHMVLSI